MQIPVVERPLFFLDYDGTLAPIVNDPDEAYPHPDVPELLRALNDNHPVWIVTGRGLEALDQFLNLSLPAIGLHGAQRGTIGGDAEHLMSDEAAEALAHLRRSVPEMGGVQVEDKQQSFAVHYRQAEREDEARRRLETWIESMPEILDAIWGKKVVELRPKELTKGTAVRRVSEEHPDRIPIYIGDDVTDEDAFESLQAMDRKAVTIKVAKNEVDTAAEYRLSGPGEVVQYLQRYAAA